MGKKVAILGGGNIGTAIATGLIKSGEYSQKNIIITRRNPVHLREFEKQGFIITSDNCEAVSNSKIIFLAVGPGHLGQLLKDIRSSLDPKHHILVSIVSGADIQQVKNLAGEDISVVRAMPNTAVSICESMTCIAGETDTTTQLVRDLFNKLGKTLVISESKMAPATALCACGIAFFLRAIRSASQGGIEIGFHSDEAFTIAAQTAKGASSLLLARKGHPEAEIDRVTTPRGATISGLNEMEHQGFSSAMIKGISVSADKVEKLYQE